MSGCNSQAADSANAGAESAVSAAAATSVLIENRVMSSNPPQPMMFARPAQPVETNHERCQPVNTMRQRGANANDFVIFSLTLHDYLSSAIDCRKLLGTIRMKLLMKIGFGLALFLPLADAARADDFKLSN